MKKNDIKYMTEEQKEVKKFIFVVLGLVVIIIGIYFFTRAFVTKDLFEKNEISYTTGKINYEKAIIGSMLNRNSKEYYVMAYSSKDTKFNYYDTIFKSYSNSKDSLNIYYVDLNEELNKSYVAQNENEVSSEFSSIKNLKLGSITLLKVKNGKVIKYIKDIEDINKELAV